MTTLTPGLDVEPVSLALNYFRPTRPQAGNLLLGRARRQRSQLFVFVEIEVEDPQGGRLRTEPAMRGPAGGTIPATAALRASSGG